MILSDEIKIFRAEAENALRVFYAFEAMSKLLTEQRYVDLVNKNIYFWKIYLSSLQTSLFIALGSLYDDSGDAFSFPRFLSRCRKHISEFNRVSLESRKLKLNSAAARPPWLNGYLAEASYATTSDIDELSRMARPYNKRLKGIYREIRNKVFAHAIHTDSDTVTSLFQDTNFAEIEEVLTAIWSIYTTVWQLFENGHNIGCCITPYPYKDEVVDSVKAVLEATA